MDATACNQPYEKDAGLCRVCRLTPVADGVRRCSRMVAESQAMRALLVHAAPIARAEAAVIVQGESGTGKEVLARTLHANSPRREGAFVAVNVAALPSELLESELFGHVRGAFTGATRDKPGLMEAARGGTLFLDEIGEMPLPLQAKLLRALQDGEVRRVGDTRATSVDVRVVCATHADLRERVEDGRFREDLFYRLKVFTLTVPPLRERRDDVMPLARHFLALHDAAHAPGGRLGRDFTPAAQAALAGCPWPGNVRELANAVTHGAVLAGPGPVDAAHLPEDVRVPVRRGRRGTFRTLAEVERDHIARVLEACGGRQADAARVLGIGRNTLWRKLRAFEGSPVE